MYLLICMICKLSTIFMKSLMSHSVCLMQQRDVFFWWRMERSMQLVWSPQLARQLKKLNSFICLTYQLSEYLKTRHKFSPTTYNNQKFYFHLCYIHSLRPYDPLNKLCALFQLILLRCFRDSILQRILLAIHKKLIGRRFCFYIDGIQKCKIVFNLRTQNFRYKMLFCMFKFCLISKYSNNELLLRILLLQIYPVCDILSIPDFGVSTVILNAVDIFCRWCKLSFRPW